VIFPILCFTLCCPFETKRGSIFLFWTGIVFFDLIGFILLTKSLSCNVGVVNRVTVLFRISSLLEFISLKMERALL
jgi:hypothetical protein